MYIKTEKIKKKRKNRKKKNSQAYLLVINK